jgi:multidrug resistance protein
MSKTKLLILFTVFIDILGIGIIIPTLPFYVESFGVSTLVVTALFGVFALLSFFSAPVLGALSDTYGRRPVLLISIASTALGWILFASAHSVWLLFIGRIIDGLAAGNIGVTQSSLADIARNPKERASNMGLIGMMFGIGLIIGPALGGLLGTFGQTVPFWFVAIMATVNFMMAIFIFPETHHVRTTQPAVELVVENNEVENVRVSKKLLKTLNPLIPIIDSVRNPKTRMIFIVFFLFSLSIGIPQAIFSLNMAETFNLTQTMVGVIIASVGVMIGLNQVLLNSVLLKRFAERKLAWLFLGVFGIGTALMGTSVLVVCLIGLVINTIGHSVARATTSSMVANIDPEKRGEYIGMMNSIMSLAMVIGPIIALLVQNISLGYPYFISAIVAVVGMWVMRRFVV